MSTPDVTRSSSAPLEPKFKWATTAAAVLTALVAVANNTSLIPGWENAPAWVKIVVAVFVIATGTGTAAYKAPHVFRSDPQARKTGVYPTASGPRVND